LEQTWCILFCDEQMRGCPVSEFIDRCRPAHQIKILRFLALLEERGPTLPRPYADLLVDGIHELRIKLSGDQIRLLYFFCYRKFIILYYAFAKTTNRVPEKFIRKVSTYRSAFLETVPKTHLEKVARENLSRPV
jgi:hypothetical protein